MKTLALLTAVKTMVIKAQNAVLTAVLTIKPNTSVDAETAMGNLLTKICGYLVYVGVGALIFGGVELGLAFLAEGQQDKKPKAIAALIGGIIIVCVKPILKSIGLISY